MIPMPDDLYPFQRDSSHARLQLHHRPERVRQDYHGACDLLRANAGLSLFLVRGAVHAPHACNGLGMPMRLAYDWRQDEIYTAASVCISCNQVAVVWDCDWIVPEDLRTRLEAAMAYLNGPIRAPPATAPCRRCGQPATVQPSETILPDASFDYAVRCDACNATMCGVGYAAFIAECQAQRNVVVAELPLSAA